MDSEQQGLAQELSAIGFTNPEAFVASHPLERIRAALALARDPEASGVKNPPGYITFLVESGEPIPEPPSVTSQREKAGKFTRGRYGHVVRR